MSDHISVLHHEAIAALDISASDVIVDATLGSAGHALTISSKLGKDGTLIGIDVDPTAITNAKRLLSADTHTIHLLNGNFKDIGVLLKQIEIEKVDGILADLGWRIEQFKGGGKGFSFTVEEPLLMTLGDPEAYPFTAHDIVNEWKEEDIANVIYAYGEERQARRIAKHITVAREKAAIETTTQLAKIIERAIPKQFQAKRIHPATKTFQALRIAVNDELDVLETFVKEAFSLLHSGGRLAIITFHSLEDRVVKQLFKSYTHDQQGILVSKKPITPSQEELDQNPRSRSAKLRVIEKL